MLNAEKRKFHIVRQGQSVARIAEFYSVSAYLLVKENGLKEEPFIGQILKIPCQTGNAYLVKAGDSKALLCGSEERFNEKNGTDVFYIGMRVIL